MTRCPSGGAEAPGFSRGAKQVRWSGLLGLAVAAAWAWALAPLEARAEDRPFIYGAGAIWGSWLGMSAQKAKAWDDLSMTTLRGMGGTSTGANFAWIDIEPSRGSYDWSRADRELQSVLDAHLVPFAYTGLTPDWALPPSAPQQKGIGYRFPPDSQYAADFDAFFKALAARYCGRVRYYEFWNEPNGCSWVKDGCANGDQAASYVPWLKRWYQAMRSGCADVVLAVGGLDCNQGTGADSCANYVKGIYDHGGGDSFDAVALHPYGDESVGSALNWQSVKNVYQVLVAHGHGGRKLWLNEYGWTADEGTKAQLVRHVLSELEKPDYDMVLQASYLSLTDLPNTPDNGHDYGLASRDRSVPSVTLRESGQAFLDHAKVFSLPEPTDAGTDGGPAGDGGAGLDAGSGDDGGAPDAGGEEGPAGRLESDVTGVTCGSVPGLAALLAVVSAAVVRARRR